MRHHADYLGAFYSSDPEPFKLEKLVRVCMKKGEVMKTLSVYESRVEDHIRKGEANGWTLVSSG